MGITQQDNYLMKNLKESANLIKGHNGWLETIQPYWIAYKKDSRNRIYNKSTYVLHKMPILKFCRKRLKFLLVSANTLFHTTKVLVGSYVCVMVEARGVEPLSENHSQWISTSIVIDL